MLKVLSSILCDLDPKVKVIGQKAGICDGVPSTSALVVHVFVVVCCQTCFKINLFKKIFQFQKHNQSIQQYGSRSIRTDILTHRSDLVPNCLQRLSAYDKHCQK